MTIGIAKARNSHIFERHEHDRYVEPAWCTKRLFAVERFSGLIWDPACGLGTILKAARDAHYSSYGSDIAQDAIGTLQDFFTAASPVKGFSIVTNPPFGLIHEFAEHALELGALKVAMICPVARLNAAHWIELLPLSRLAALIDEDIGGLEPTLGVIALEGLQTGQLVAFEVMAGIGRALEPAHDDGALGEIDIIPPKIAGLTDA